MARQNRGLLHFYPDKLNLKLVQLDCQLQLSGAHLGTFLRGKHQVLCCGRTFPSMPVRSGQASGTAALPWVLTGPGFGLWTLSHKLTMVMVMSFDSLVVLTLVCVDAAEAAWSEAGTCLREVGGGPAS